MLPLVTPRRVTTIFAGCFALAMLVAPGCSTANDPIFTVVEASVAEETPNAVQALFTFEGENTNEIELPLLQAEYTLEIDGRRVFAGERAPQATLRRLGKQRFTLPGVVPVGAGQPRPTGVRPFRISGTIEYVAPGAIAEALFDLGVRRPRAPFSGTGEIDFGSGPAAPAATASPPAPGSGGAPFVSASAN